MKMEDKIKVVAEFDGWKCIPNPKKPRSRKIWYHDKLCRKLMGDWTIPQSLTSLKYDTDWNLLMRACRKFDRLKVSRCHVDYVNHCERIDSSVTRYEITEVFEILYEAIIWLNTINPNRK